ncbi:cytochrome P450 [Aspergillus spinulosporus]
MALSLFGEALQHALSTNILRLLLSAATLGFTVEEYLYGLLGLYTATVVAVTVAYLTTTPFSLLQVFFHVGCISAAFNTGLASSIAIYQLFFHRLRRLQYHVEIAAMHNKYGDFFRTGPREIRIVRKSAVPLFLSPQSNCGKSTFYAQAQTEAKYCNVHQTRDPEDHHRQRKAWDRGFSVKALLTYEPSIGAKADLLISHLEKNRAQAIDVTKWSMFLNFDIMGKVGFGKELNNLSTGMEHPGIKAIHDHMAILGVMGHVPWLLDLFSHLPGATSSMAEFFKWCEDDINWDINEPPQDVTSWLLKAYIQKEVSATPTENALHEDSRAVIVAGSKTTATTLASILYYLCKNPEILAKLQRLLDEAMPGGPLEWTYDKIKTISYLDDIIGEMLRLRPEILTGGYRVTPVEGLQVDELIQTDERYYKEMIQEGAPYFPFLYSLYVCPGKNLALMSLGISVSKLAQLYDKHFAPGETGELFETRTLDTFTTTLPPLHVQFVHRYMR